MNMSYCRFHNTYNDLNDCETALNEFIVEGVNTISSEKERDKAKQLIELCRYIADNYSEEDIDECAKQFEDEYEEGED